MFSCTLLLLDLDEDLRPWIKQMNLHLETLAWSRQDFWLQTYCLCWSDTLKKPISPRRPTVTYINGPYRTKGAGIIRPLLPYIFRMVGAWTFHTFLPTHTKSSKDTQHPWQNWRDLDWKNRRENKLCLTPAFSLLFQNLSPSLSRCLFCWVVGCLIRSLWFLLEWLK